jgi:hypothetical protein
MTGFRGITFVSTSEMKKKKGLIQLIRTDLPPPKYLISSLHEDKCYETTTLSPYHCDMKKTAQDAFLN